MSELLRLAEGVDSYRRRCAVSEYNAEARRGNEYEPFFIGNGIATFLEDFARETPLLNRAKIIIMRPSADCGFPHTRPGNLICMPSTTCLQTDSCKETLIHEGIHLHQRTFMNDWMKYCSAQGWTQRWADSVPSQYIERVRINPDTMMCPYWSWQEYYVPLPLFIEKPALRLPDVTVKWLDIRASSFVDAPPSFYRRYGAASQPEHPFELAAVEMATTCRSDDDVFNIIR